MDKTVVSRAFYRSIAWVGKKSPEILIVVGAAGAVTATVLACKATLKLKEKTEECQKRIEETKEVYSDVIAENDKNDPELKVYKKELAKDYAHFGWEMAKLYGPAALVGVGALSCFVGGDIIQSKRAAQLAAAATIAESALVAYRKNVVEAFGEEVDRDMRYGIKTKVVETKTTDKKGNEKIKTEKLSVVDENTGHSDYARFFDASCSDWTKDPEYNLMFLQAVQHECNILLKSRGHLFLNEVYDKLGLPRTQAGAVVGWIFDPECPNGDNEVDFRIYDVTKDANRRFVNGYENVILIDPNVDGVIYNKI